MNFKEAWDRLHEQPRYRPKYPDDRVVAWTFRNFARDQKPLPTMLDLGCGAGRHAIFFATEGFEASACDFSAVGVDETKKRAVAAGLNIATAVCEADELPYENDSFDGVLVYGTFTYLPYDRFCTAVEQVRRVLKPGGKALIVTRTSRDSRTDHAEKIGHATYRIVKMGAGAPSEVEEGMVMTFLDDADADKVFSRFGRVVRDRLTTTMSGGSYIDDDWYIHVEK